MAPEGLSSHSVYILLFLFSFAVSQTPTSATDTLSANQSLSGNKTLISSNGNFELGFFKPGNSSQNQYIGIWFYKVSKGTPVWVANRENPVTDSTKSELKISDNGNLVLLNDSRAIVWSTNANISSDVSTVAVLLDNGSLQLRDGSNSSKLFWQSLDHPTNTWLPGGKLGRNKRTNETQRITAWKNSDDPALGYFSLEMDPNGTSQFFLIWNNSRIYWSSGLWNDKMFTQVPEMSSVVPNTTFSDIYRYEYVSNNGESYFTYFIRDGSFSRTALETSGQVKSQTWVETAQEWILFWSAPKQQCQVYAFCGSFGSCNDKALSSCKCVKGFSEKSPNNWNLGDQSSGCARNTPLQCQSNNSLNVQGDKFYKMSNMRLPDNSLILASESDEDCESACLKNCSCTAYSYNTSGCIIWYGDLVNLQEEYDGSDAGTLYLRLAASELPSTKSKKKEVTLAIVGAVAGFLACFAIFGLTIWRRRYRRGLTGTKKAAGTLVAFTYSALQHATKNFSEKLGGGGFGSVFKGSLPDSTAIAVKMLQGISQGEKQFRTEVSTIGTIQHVNLIRLLGFCSEGTKKLLVYEYMPNGSLATQLFQSTSKVLDWNTRYQIALGIARGLAYLHEKCRDCIIHCDIKPENILLDSSFIPKVADFGLAKLVGRDFSRVLTTMRGTRGYLAPEWITGMPITAKADVYSYGMMLFEIISGRRNTENAMDSGAEYFPAIAANRLIKGNVTSLLDDRLSSDAILEELERACKVACWCIQDNEKFRPTMGQVVQILENVIEVDVPPIPRSLTVFAENPEQMVFFSDCSSNHSSADLPENAEAKKSQGS